MRAAPVLSLPLILLAACATDPAELGAGFAPKSLLTTGTTTLSGLSVGDASGAGDVNGDGYDDVVAFDDSTGRLYWYLGSSSGISSTAAGYLSAYTFAADAVVDAAGDTNNDGYDDIVVGNPSASANRGQVLLFRGSASGLSASAARTHTGIMVNTRMGLEVAGVGDTNGDGRDDYAAANANGVVSVFRGMPGTMTAPPTRVTVPDWTHTHSMGWLGIGESPGHTLAGGDLNGDGYSDVVVGRAEYDNGVSGYSPGPTGAVDVYFGSAAGMTTSPQTIVWPYGYWYDNYSSICYSWQQMGYSVAVTGDTNSDGYNDLVVGVPGDCEFGATAVYYGGAGGVDDTQWAYVYGRDMSSPWDWTGMFSGYSLATGDFDGDGHGDFATGGGADSYVESNGVGFTMSYGSSYAGAVNPLYATELAGTDYVTDGWTTITLANVDTVGDVNADGCDDLLVQNPTSLTTWSTLVYYGYNCTGMVEADTGTPSPM